MTSVPISSPVTVGLGQKLIPVSRTEEVCAGVRNNNDCGAAAKRIIKPEDNVELKLHCLALPFSPSSWCSVQILTLRDKTAGLVADVRS